MIELELQESGLTVVYLKELDKIAMYDTHGGVYDVTYLTESDLIEMLNFLKENRC